MRRNTLAILAAVVAAVLSAPAAHAAGGCTGVSVKGPKSVPEAAGVASFTIAADELPAVEPPPPPIDSQPPPSASRPRQSCVVEVSYATVDGSARAGADYLPISGTVTLEPGQKRTIDVPVADDQSDEPDEDFSLQTDEGSATATIIDDDVPPTLSVAAAPGVEGAAAQVFIVTLSAPSAFPVSAGYATSDGTATAGADYMATSGTVSFPPGATKQIVSVPLVDDRVREGDESFALTLSAPQGAALGPPVATAVVRDNDGPTGTTGPSGPSGPTLVPAIDKLAPMISVPPGKQDGETVVFTVSCPAVEQVCSGRVRLDLLASGKGARAAAKASLGSATYKLKGGEKKKVRVKLNKRGKRLLEKRKKLRVKATFRTRDAAGNVATTSQILTLHAAAFRHS